MDTRGSGCGVIRIASSMGGRNYCMRELSGHALVAEADALFRNERIPHPLLDHGLLCKPFDSRLTGAVDGRPRRRHAQWPAEGNHASRRAWNAQNASIRAANAPEARCPHTRPKMLIDAFTCVLVQACRSALPTSYSAQTYCRKPKGHKGKKGKTTVPLPAVSFLCLFGSLQYLLLTLVGIPGSSS